MAVLSPISDYYIPVSFSGLEEVGGVERIGEVSASTLFAAGQGIVLIFIPRQRNFSLRNKKVYDCLSYSTP